MNRIAGLVTVAVIFVSGCTAGPNLPTPGPGLSPRCAAMLDEFDRAKANATASPSDDTKAALKAAQGELFASGCLKS
jgi:hypothetical protein